MDWFRLHHGTVNDPKLRVVSRNASVTVRDVLSVWICMLDCASQAPERGCLDGWDDEAIAVSLEMDAAQVRAIYEAMQGRMLDGDRIRNWEKRQPKREDTTAAKRQRDRRVRERDSETVTHRHASSRNVTTEERRLEEIREEAASAAIAPRDVVGLLHSACSEAGIDQGKAVNWLGIGQGWLALGLQDERILAVIREVAARPGYKPPGTLAYFTPMLTEAAKAPQPQKPAELSPEERAKLPWRFVRAYKRDGQWRGEGPPPGAKGCTVDPAILREFGYEVAP
jgi:hypothetical protein